MDKSLLLLLLVLGTTPSRTNGQPVQWRVEDGGNGHYYELVGNYLDVNSRWSWQDSKVMAENRVYLGTQGHLATITSPAENLFLVTTFHNAKPWPTWIGLTDSESFGGRESFGLPNPKTNGWVWITGEAVAYTDWTPGNPDNTGNEDFALMGNQLGNHHNWNDEKGDAGAHAPFFVEYEVRFTGTGTTYFVDGTYGNDTNSGRTWGAAKATIQSAVNVAKPNDKVLVNAGIYEISTTLVITNGVTVRGLMGADHTFIDGGFPARSIRCVRLANEGALLDGFTIRNGSEGVVFDGEGSGIMRNCVVKGMTGNGVAFLAGGTAQSCNIVNNGGIGLYVADMGGGGEPAVNLILFGNGTNFHKESANLVLDHCLLVDPRFIGTNDFRLRSDSPALGNGKSLPWMSSAIAAQGNARLYNGRVDIGAYEALRFQAVRNPANGHYYAYVRAQVGWSQARKLALGLSYIGMRGYLANITSRTEQNFVASSLGGTNGFLGGSDSAIEGEWRWMDGPEANTLFYRHSNLQTLTFSNWGEDKPNSFDNRPDVTGYPGEDFLAFHYPEFGLWNDVPDSPFPLPGFYVEFSEPPPILAMAAFGQSMVLAWPTNQIGFTLEETIALGPLDWKPTTMNVFISTDRYLAIVPMTSSNQFFRLVKP